MLEWAFWRSEGLSRDGLTWRKLSLIWPFQTSNLPLKGGNTQ